MAADRLGRLPRLTAAPPPDFLAGDFLVGDLDGHPDADVLRGGSDQVCEGQAGPRLLGQLAQGDEEPEAAATLGTPGESLGFRGYRIGPTRYAMDMANEAGGAAPGKRAGRGFRSHDLDGDDSR